MTKLRIQRAVVHDAYDVYDEWLASCAAKGLSQKTLEVYRNQVKQYLDFLEPESIKDVTQDSIREYITYVNEDDVSDVTIQTYIRQVKTFISYCQNEGYIENFKVVLPKAEGTIKETYTDDELQRLLKKPNMATVGFKEFEYYSMACFLLGTGCRIGTLLNIRIKDIDLDNRTVAFVKNKQKKPQFIPLSDVLVKTIREWLFQRQAKSDDEYLFCTVYGAKCGFRNTAKGFQAYGAKRGVNGATFHKFRHTFSRHYILNGGDVVRLSRILGHSSVAVTENYLKTIGMDVEDLRTDYQALSPLDNIVTSSNRLTIKQKS